MSEILSYGHFGREVGGQSVKLQKVGHSVGKSTFEGLPSEKSPLQSGTKTGRPSFIIIYHITIVLFEFEHIFDR